MAIAAEQILGSQQGSVETDGDMQRAGGIFAQTASLDDLFGTGEGSAEPIEGVAAPAAPKADSPRAPAPMTQTAPPAAPDEPADTDQVDDGLAAQQQADEFAPEVREAFERIAALPREQYAQFVRRNPTHPLAVYTQGEASRMIRNLKRATAQQEAELTAKAAELQQFQEYRQTVLDANQHEDLDKREAAREKMATAEYQAMARQEQMADPAIWEQAGTQALEYFVESLRTHPVLAKAGKKAFDEARAKQSPGEYAAHILNAYIAKHKLVPEAEVEARVAARVKDNQSKTYAGVKGYDLSRNEGAPSFDATIDIRNVDAADLFNQAFGVDTPRAATRR
jgi:hypothetical protein